MKKLNSKDDYFFNIHFTCNIIKSFASVILFLSFMSCNGRVNNNNTEDILKTDSTLSINIQEILKQENTVLNLSDEVEKIDIVSLETIEQSLLTNSSDALIFSGYL